jgi:hypothetical protein
MENQKNLPDILPRTEATPPTVMVPNTVRTDEVAKSFVDACVEADRTRGWGLAKTWKQCIRFNDDNAMMHTNMRQMQVVLQQHMTEWAEMKVKFRDVLEAIELRTDDKSSAEYMSALDWYTTMSNKTSKILSTLNTTIRDMKKEVRMTAMQSRFMYHVNLVQQFMTGLTAVLHKHLQKYGPEVVDAVIMDIRQLGGIFRNQEERTEEEDDDEGR